MRILITGGAGMVGSHVAELLEARGDEVVIVDNLATGRKDHLANLKTNHVHFASISDREFLENIQENYESFDAIVHAAASFSNGQDWEEHIETNIRGSAEVTRLAQHFNCRLVYFQTALCYGANPTIQPVPLDYPRQPFPSSYAISKTAGEFYIEQSGIDYVTFRLANIVGPRNLSGPLPIFFRRITSNQPCVIVEAKRDFVDVRDLATVVVQACDGAGRGPYHFSSGSDVRILDLFHAVCKELGLPEEPQFEFRGGDSGGPSSILLDPTKTWKDFEVPDLRSMSETVRGAIAYYKQYGVEREITHLKGLKRG